MGRWAILNGLLGIIVLLLGLQIAWTWTRTLPPVDFSARSTEALPKDGSGAKGERRGKRNADKAPATPAAMVVTIVNKDLFDPSRQKATEEVKIAAPKEAPPPPNVTLVGVRILGKDREAFILDAGQPQRRVRTGDQVGGYTVKTIRPTRVTLSAGSGEIVDLKLTVEKGAAPAAPAVPGARAPGAPRPGQPGATPPGTPAPSPAAGVQPRQPHGPAAAAAAAAAARQHQPGGAPPAPQNPNVPQLPAGVREKLEQLKGN